MTAFSPTFPEKKSKYNIYFPESFRQWKKNYFPGCGKLFASMDITAVRRANLFLAKSESKGTELSGVVNLLEVDIWLLWSLLLWCQSINYRLLLMLWRVCQMYIHINHIYRCWNGQSVSIDIYELTDLQVFVTFFCCFIFAVSRCRDSYLKWCCI